MALFTLRNGSVMLDSNPLLISLTRSGLDSGNATGQPQWPRTDRLALHWSNSLEARPATRSRPENRLDPHPRCGGSPQVRIPFRTAGEICVLRENDFAPGHLEVQLTTSTKGKVEGLLGYARRNFFVPAPRCRSYAELNERLQAECRLWGERKLRGHSETIEARLERDLAAMLPRRCAL